LFNDRLGRWFGFGLLDNRGRFWLWFGGNLFCRRFFGLRVLLVKIHKVRNIDVVIRLVRNLHVLDKFNKRIDFSFYVAGFGVGELLYFNKKPDAFDFLDKWFKAAFFINVTDDFFCAPIFQAHCGKDTFCFWGTINLAFNLCFGLHVVGIVDVFFLIDKSRDTLGRKISPFQHNVADKERALAQGFKVNIGLCNIKVRIVIIGDLQTLLEKESVLFKDFK